MKFTPKTMTTERFDVQVAYQAPKGLTHIIFGDKDGVGMRACTFTHYERHQLIAWLLKIDDADLLPGEEPCPDCKGTGVGLRMSDGEVWPCRRCRGSGNLVMPPETDDPGDPTDPNTCPDCGQPDGQHDETCMN